MTLVSGPAMVPETGEAGPAGAVGPGGSVRRGQGRRGVARDRSIWLLAVPGIVFFAVFSYAPMVGIVVAFKSYNVSEGILGSPWNGVENFRFFLGSGDAGRVLFNTLFLNSLFLVATTVSSVLLAIFLNEIRLRYVKRLLQSTIFLPYFISPVVVSLMLQGFLQGIGGGGGMVNEWLTSFGLPQVNWYAEPGAWPWILTVLKVWQMSGYLSIIYLATITSIPEEVYEAGRIDGASSRKLAWHITLPMLVPTMLVLLLLNIGRIFYGDFATIYAIVGDNGALFPTTDVIDTYVFRALRTLGDFGMTAAIGLMQSVVGLVFVSVATLLARRYARKSGLM
ncbi:ABC transporter permease [Actinopolymorpha rutila]|uniref:Putative aldouronate transport system permease protein n=1 Tax=Actinopolymorpha rutila TaxID=446787 RepID=A0A852ZC72_9ACTN|nr:ABC transporter permease subunit [Actinopolymorpha rutila]NYH90747.1 putative aldouronate transport system permease protein [Actinopolymorpha rutila]